MTKRKIITAVIAVILILAAGAYKLYLQGEEAKILTGTVEATKADVITIPCRSPIKIHILCVL